MSELEMAVEALKLCVSPAAYEKAMERVRDSAGTSVQTGEKADPEEVIEQMLVELGMPSHIKGYRYTVTAIKLLVDDPDIINAVTNELYPQVAKAHQTTPSRVERAIRHGIELVCDRSDIDVIHAYFGNSMNIDKGKPTNSEFLSRVAGIARRKIERGA